MSGGPDPLAGEERRDLLRLAREAIAAHLAGAPPPPLPADRPRLLRPAGAFVTLRSEGGALRGCIGVVEPAEPLAATIRRCAVAAAVEDPRFPPLLPAELHGLHIEISVLTPPCPVTDPTSLTIGRHGLIASRGRRRGLLLPQVPVEQGWDLETFLRETCLKAGLPPSAWKEGAAVESFEAEVFGEPERPAQ